MAGVLAAIADHKMVLLPAAIVLWETARVGGRWGVQKAVMILAHPVVVGFGLGTLMFWAYGLSISPRDFWMDHVRHHLVDRVLHNNARGLDMSEYPGVAAVWLEFLQHTAFVLVPFGTVALAWLSVSRPADDGRGITKAPSGWQGTSGLWAIWALLIAAVFSLVDWRQTKHLAPLTLPLYLALMRVGQREPIRTGTGLVLTAILIWNIRMVLALATDFGVLPAVPDW